MASTSSGASDVVSENDSRSAFANPIWKYYFKLPGGGTARCESCQSVLKTPTGTTTTLVTHLKRHPGTYKAYLSDRQQKVMVASKRSAAKESSSPVSVASIFKPKLQPTSPRAKEMTRKIATFIARDLQPYSVVEAKSFVDMINYAMPEYVIPSRNKFSRTIIPDLYATKMNELKVLMREIFGQGVQCYTLTTDAWSSKAGDSYVSVTVHMLDCNFVQHAFALACKPMPEGHTADNILRFLQAVSKEWDLPDNIPTFVVTDNGRNFVSAVARSSWERLQCFGHTLQLCISDVKKEVSSFGLLCAKSRSIVGHYKKSTRARGRLLEIQNDMRMQALEVIQDVPTRWNSEHAMLARLLKLRAPISVELSESDSVENLSAQEWKLMNAVVKVLQPLEQATAELSADHYPTLSQVIPLLHCTRVMLEEHISGADEAAPFASSLLRSLSTRFPDIKMAKVPALAMLIDPRFKSVCYTTETEKKWAKALLTSSAEKLPPPLQEHDQEPSVKPGPAMGATSTVWTVFSELSSTARKETDNGHAARQAADYLSAPLLPRAENPLDWWKGRGSQLYPALAKVAQMYLSIPATQTRSERLFSTAGSVVSNRRELLLTEHVEQLVFLHENL